MFGVYLIFFFILPVRCAENSAITSDGCVYISLSASMIHLHLDLKSVNILFIFSFFIDNVTEFRMIDNALDWFQGNHHRLTNFERKPVYFDLFSIRLTIFLMQLQKTSYESYGKLIFRNNLVLNDRHKIWIGFIFR